MIIALLIGFLVANGIQSNMKRISAKMDEVAKGDLSVEVKAKPAEVILLAGKGHEDYQIIGTEKRHFDEHEIVREIFDELKD